MDDDGEVSRLAADALVKDLVTVLGTHSVGTAVTDRGLIRRGGRTRDLRTAIRRHGLAIRGESDRRE